VAFSFLPGSERGGIVEMGWYAIFMGSWYAVLHIAPGNPMNPLWSISVEEQFYVCAPWIAKYFSRKMLFGFCIVVLLLSNARLYWLGTTHAPGYSIWFDSIVQFQCFAAGMLLCLFLRGHAPKIASWQRPVLLAVCGGCWFFASYGLHALFTYTSTKLNPGSWRLIGGYALGTLGCVLFLIAFLGIDARLLPRWAIYLGRISFGLYVYHQLALNVVKHIPIGHVVRLAVPLYFLRTALGLGLNIVMAAISYRYFETPFLKMKKRHAFLESQPVLGDR
jgi:peptidoglycan/LPS O-acetylase OafA/YrhL